MNILLTAAVLLGGVVAADSLSPRGVLAYDVVVYDATSGGVMAAVSASRKGLNTLLLCASWPSCFDEGGRRLGGMTSGGLGQTDIGDTGPYIGGLAREFYHRNWKHYNTTSHLYAHSINSDSCRLPSGKCNITYNVEPHVAASIFEDMLEDAGVSIRYNSQVVEVNKFSSPRGGAERIHSIVTADAATIEGKVFIDASYEGDLMAAAGIQYVVGREAASQFNESLAGMSAGSKKNQFNVAVDPFDEATGLPLPLARVPEVGRKVGSGDAQVQAYNFRLCLTKNRSNQIPFTKPIGYSPAKWELLKRYILACMGSGGERGVGKEAKIGCAIGFPSCNLGKIPNNKVDMNNCGGFSSDYIGGSLDYPEANYEDRKRIWYAHLRYTQGLLYFMSNDPSVPETVRDTMQEWGLCADEFGSNRLAPHWPPTLYVRGARRLRGPHIFTQNSPKELKDLGYLSIGVGGYNFDSHNGQRLACKNRSSCYGSGPPDVGTNSFAWDEGDVEINPGLYEIPYWVMTPKKETITNLLVIATPSTSHIGMSTLRMEPQFMILGHAAGTAAYVAIKNKTSVQEIDMPAFHSILQAEKMITHI